MEYRLVKSISENKEIIFDLVGFEKWEDFLESIDIIKNIIDPDKINYQGITDMNGYFEKYGVTLEIEYTSMLGIYLIYRGKRKKENLEIIDNWAKIIFNNLLKRKRVN